MAGENNDHTLRPPIDREIPTDRAYTQNLLRRIFFGSCRFSFRRSNVSSTAANPSNPNWASTSYDAEDRDDSFATSFRGILPRASAMTVTSYDSKMRRKNCCLDLKGRCASRFRTRQSVDPETIEHKRKNRLIFINGGQRQHFISNATKTAKYTVWTFMPLFLFEQFRKYTNLFFLIMATLQQIPGISPTGRYITLFPLLFILTVSAIKEIVEDKKRHRADTETNRRSVDQLQGNQWKRVCWKDLEVGNFVRIKDKEYFPADLLLLASDNSDGICFVETSNLDGESNLKIRKAVPETKHLIDENALTRWTGVIECDPPNRRIYSYFGVLSIPNEEPITLGPDQILQRGSALNNTAWIHGLVVYTGHETKLMKNYAQAPLKSSSIERLLNRQFISLFALFLCVSLTSGAMYLTWLYRNVAEHTYLGIEDHVFGGKEIVVNVLTYLILYNNLIPISLTVTLEMVHYFQALFINADVGMYHEKTNTFAMARSSNLNAELGMVQYILTDKTGTLTCNIMKFKQCSIAGIIYDIEDDMTDSELVQNLTVGHSTVPVMEEFLLVIALCHSVVSQIKEDGQIVYHATSPDDLAIIESAKKIGYEFITRGVDYMDIMRFGQTERYTLLQTIDFTPERKRMSVLVRMPEGNIKLLCKGADSTILARLSSDERDYYSVTRDHLERMASMGLRTLCCAASDISEEQFRDWTELYHSAMSQFVNRDIEMEHLEEQIEQNLRLLGVTAVEDKLQDGVPDTIRFILNARIRVWMLTGDKQETAINIAYASSLIDNTMRVIKLNESSLQNTFRALYSKSLYRRPLKNVALIIDGPTLEFALSKDLYDAFQAICVRCAVVVCCRLSPMQKGKITDMINRTGACTLAIGDGANDVTMIRRARVGVGISGMEGLQAASASDFSISQFRFLKRLLFVHGTLDFYRSTTVVFYSFYKNILLCIMLMWYCFYNGWSAQVLFDRWIIAGWNIAFTSWQPLAIGIFDKICSENTLLRYPRIYASFDNSKLFSILIFWVWILLAVFHSMILFWFSLLLLSKSDTVWKNGLSMDLNVYGNTIYTAAITVVSLKAGLLFHSWNFFSHLSIWGSIAMWFCTLVSYSYFWPVIPMGPEFSYSHISMFTSLKVWLVVLVVIIVTLLPDVYLKIITNTFLPPLTLTAEIKNKIELSRNRT